jgi:hypothetical protein
MFWRIPRYDGDISQLPGVNLEACIQRIPLARVSLTGETVTRETIARVLELTCFIAEILEIRAE